MSTPGAGAAQDALPRLVAQVAHDLNNHLATILGKAELGLMLEDPARWKRGLEEALCAGQSARVLVADLQRVVRWQQGEDSPATIADAVSTAIRLCGRAIERCNIRLTDHGHGGADNVARPADITLALVVAIRALVDHRAPRPAQWVLTASAGPRGACLALDLGDETVDPARLDTMRANLAALPVAVAVEGARLRLDVSP